MDGELAGVAGASGHDPAGGARGRPRVLLLLGSESDRPVMREAAEILAGEGVEVEVEVSSAHRDPRRTAELASSARERGFAVVICGAGLSAALPGVVAAHTDLPVIGVPIAAGTLGGIDALLSIVQMPPGVPVAAVGINGARNAAQLALRILGVAGRADGGGAAEP